MEVVEEINRIGDDRLDFLETFEEHREALLHVLKNTSAIPAAVLGQDYLRWMLETYFGLRDNIISMVDSMDFLEANQCELHHSQKILKCLSYANQMQTALFKSHHKWERLNQQIF